MRTPITSMILSLIALGTATSPLAADQQEKVADSFREVARKMFVEILPELPSEERRKACKALKCAPSELAKKFAAKLVENSPNVFRVSPEQAKEILAGRFDNRGNRKRLKLAVEILGQFKTKLPRPTTYWMEKHAAGGIPRGIKLEFAARFLGAQAETVKRALGARGGTPRG